ncbi:hypothetical protein MTO96_006287 [Rhipicephalus appendiculatus]
MVGSWTARAAGCPAPLAALTEERARRTHTHAQASLSVTLSVFLFLSESEPPRWVSGPLPLHLLPSLLEQRWFPFSNTAAKAAAAAVAVPGPSHSLPRHALSLARLGPLSQPQLTVRYVAASGGARTVVTSRRWRWHTPLPRKSRRPAARRRLPCGRPPRLSRN